MLTIKSRINMLANLVCPISSERIDSNVSRLTIFISVILVTIFVITLNTIPLYIAAFDYFVRAFTPGTLSPLRFIATFISTTIGITPKMMDKAPKVFASRLGFLCLLAASILINLGLTTPSIVVTIMAGSLFFLDAAGIVCVGCLIYYHIVYPFFNKK